MQPQLALCMQYRWDHLIVGYAHLIDAHGRATRSAMAGYERCPVFVFEGACQVGPIAMLLLDRLKLDGPGASTEEGRKPVPPFTWLVPGCVAADSMQTCYKRSWI